MMGWAYSAAPAVKTFLVFLSVQAVMPQNNHILKNKRPKKKTGPIFMLVTMDTVLQRREGRACERQKETDKKRWKIKRERQTEKERKKSRNCPGKRHYGSVRRDVRQAWARVPSKLPKHQSCGVTSACPNKHRHGSYRQSSERLLKNRTEHALGVKTHTWSPVLRERQIEKDREREMQTGVQHNCQTKQSFPCSVRGCVVPNACYGTGPTSPTGLQQSCQHCE